MKKQNPGATTSAHVFRRIHTGSGASRLIDKIIGAAPEPHRTPATLQSMIEKMGMTFQVNCAQCKETTTLSLEQLKTLFPDWSLPLSDIKPHCPQCGSVKTSSTPVKL